MRFKAGKTGNDVLLLLAIKSSLSVLMHILLFYFFYIIHNISFLEMQIGFVFAHANVHFHLIH